MRTRRTLYILGFCIAIFAVSLVGTIECARNRHPRRKPALVPP